MADFSGLFTEGYALLSGKMPMRNQIRRLVLKNGFRKNRELFDTAIGAAAGEAASASFKRIAEDSGQGGGQRTIDTVSVISRNTDAADITALKEMTVNVDRSAAYPGDLSGNGGPAMA